MTTKPNPPQWAIDAATEVARYDGLMYDRYLIQNERDAVWAFATIIACHAPQPSGQAGDEIRALVQALKDADLPDPEAVRELVEAARQANLSAQVLFIAAAQSARDISFQAKLALQEATKDFGDKWGDVQLTLAKFPVKR